MTSLFRFRYCLLIAGLLTGAVACTPVDYKPASPLGASQDGYLDEEIAPGVFVIEVRQMSGFQFLLNYDDTISTFRAHWHRRAGELCAAGYLGEPEVLLPAEARLQQFVCTDKACRNYPLVSGIAYCHQRYSL
ncbi:hypothetical protein ACQUQU_00520 [Thalassolituus sp. LLYu03]|uniref:hypothetical protein n=1 Tax=Thalassolituus sp. LLYu03 TaxID=3421656 RepID=UPI003D2C6A65